jgi:hypothetical protein
MTNIQHAWNVLYKINIYHHDNKHINAYFGWFTFEILYSQEKNSLSFIIHVYIKYHKMFWYRGLDHMVGGFKTNHVISVFHY